MAVREVKATKEEVKEGTRDGTQQEVTKEAKVEVKQVSHSPPSPSATATNAAAKDTWLKTAQEEQAR